MSKRRRLKDTKFIESLGWCGAALLIIALALVSFKIVQSDSYTYIILNILGALGLVIISIVKKVRQTIVVNVIWGSIAVLALLKLILRI